MKYLAILFITLTLILLSGCAALNAPPFTIKFMNQANILSTGDLEIKVCFIGEMDLSQLFVNVYVTERKEWSELKDALPYTSYINKDFVSIPGTISPPIDASLWKKEGDSCYVSLLQDAFVNTGDWSDKRMCPFKGIAVFANYENGAWNAADVIECSFTN